MRHVDGHAEQRVVASRTARFKGRAGPERVKLCLQRGTVQIRRLFVPCNQFCLNPASTLRHNLADGYADGGRAGRQRVEPVDTGTAQRPGRLHVAAGLNEDALPGAPDTNICAPTDRKHDLRVVQEASARHDDVNEDTDACGVDGAVTLDEHLGQDVRRAARGVGGHPFNEHEDAEVDFV